MGAIDGLRFDLLGWIAPGQMTDASRLGLLASSIIWRCNATIGALKRLNSSATLLPLAIGIVDDQATPLDDDQWLWAMRFFVR